MVLKKNNEEIDHEAAVPVSPIVINDLETQIDQDSNTDTKTISLSICLYVICFFRRSTQITLKSRKCVLFDCVQKLYFWVNMDSRMLYMEIHGMNHLFN